MGSRNINRVRGSSVTAHGGQGLIEVARIWGGEDVPFPADSGFEFVEVAMLPPGASIGEHRHEASTEIYLVLNGCGEYLQRDAWVPVEEGDVLVNHCGVHALRNTGRKSLRVFVVESAARRGQP